MPALTSWRENFKQKLDNSLISNYNMPMNKYDIISLISKIRTNVNRHIEQEMSKHHMVGIVTSHGDILYTLFHRERMTMAELAESIGKDKSTVTSLVNKLEDLGYVQKDRSSTDARVVYVSLTDKGISLKPIFDQISNDIIQMVFKDIPESEQDELFRLLKKVYDNL